MGLLSRRRPKVERLKRKGKIDELCRAAAYEDVVQTTDGPVDLGRPVRREAMAALRELGDERAVPAACAALSDSDEEVATEAARTLRDHEASDEISAALLGAADPPHEAARDELHRALLDQDDPELALRYAERLVQDGAARGAAEDEREFLEALLITGQASDRRVVADVAIAALAPGDPHRRARAFLVLSCLGDAGVEALAAALERPEPAGAAWALGRLRNSTVLPALIDLLEDGDRHVRATAAWALGEIRDPRAVEGLLKASTDAEYMVREACLEALDNLGTAAVVFAVAAFVQPVLQAPAASAAAQPELPPDEASISGEVEGAPRQIGPPPTPVQRFRRAARGFRSSWRDS